MKGLADCVIKDPVEKNIKTVFMVTGGVTMFLMMHLKGSPRSKQFITTNTPAISQRKAALN